MWILELHLLSETYFSIARSYFRSVFCTEMSERNNTNFQGLESYLIIFFSHLSFIILSVSTTEVKIQVAMWLHQDV